MCHRLFSDLGQAGTKQGTRLLSWWNLDCATFRREVNKTLKQDVSLRQRDDWEAYLAAQRQRHTELSAAIIAHEQDLRRRVYGLSELTDEEIALIEESTKYPYGAA